MILVGIVSLFADATYEGARSVVGPYLGLLGASATVVGVVAGFGELSGYVLRLAAGYLSDRTRRYWAVTITGYAVNMLAVPLLALASSWQVAAVFVIAERLGKGLRVPARDAMLSHATQQVGHGWGFGLHEALDQTGALVGPVAVATILFVDQGYPAAFAWLAVPAVACLAVLLFAWRQYPNPSELEVAPPKVTAKGFSRAFWTYLVASVLVAAAFADFALIAFHFGTTNAIAPVGIPILYAVAMGVDGLASLIFGRLFDRIGFRAVALGFLIASLFAPLVFLGGVDLIVIGVVMWGIGMGTQESIMRSAVASMIPADRRASAFGVFNLFFGVSWFLGSSLMGYLYDVSIVGLVVFSVVVQFAAIPIVLRVRTNGQT